MTARTQTGGRDATQAIIPGRYALSVGKPNLPEPAGFRWRLLASLARLEGGHTPSRKKSAYWDGEIPWIGIRDATGNHGKIITATVDSVSQEGLDNSSARLLPRGTVCLSRTASVGYVVEMGRPMATSQDFVNWVPGPELNGRYLRYLLMAEQESVRRFAHGTTHQTMYYPEAKALHVLIPARRYQDAVANVLGALEDKIAVNSRCIQFARQLMLTLARASRSQARLADIAEPVKKAVNPAAFEPEVALFSIPAFDAGEAPEACPRESIKSNKFSLSLPCVLLSKLNPRFPRVWDVSALPEAMAVASTEFVVLVPRDVSTSQLWASLAQDSVQDDLLSRVSGTSGSHQRVKPAEILQIRVPDPRGLELSSQAQITCLGRLGHALRIESLRLRATRDELLPLLMSGKVRVKDAEKIVEEVT